MDTAAKLCASFQSLYVALQFPRVARRTLAVLLLSHAGLLAYSAYVHSPTLNEPGHLVAGLCYWKFGRFEVYSVNPPLLKMVAALPVLATGFNENWSSFDDGIGARPEMQMGKDFVVANRERSFNILMFARWACIPFGLLGGAVCYLWARDLYGRPSGVLACAFWCFEPNILGHAALITSDVAGTALALTACYTFWRWLKRPTWTQSILAGAVLGLAELTKTTFLILIPLWPILWFIYRWPARHAMKVNSWLREAVMLALRMTVAWYVLNLGYGFQGTFTRLDEFQFVSTLFAEMQKELSSSVVGNLPMPLPKHYIIGLDLQQRDFEHYPRQSFLNGSWQSHGWWYYYLCAAGVKVPLSIWAMCILAIYSRMKARYANDHTHWLDEFILMFPALVIFVVISSKCGFSEHFRYALPTLPPILIAVSQLSRIAKSNSPLAHREQKTQCVTRYFIAAEGVSNTIPEPRRKDRSLDQECRKMFSSSILFTAFACWLVASSLWIYPHSLSYFNEAIGGPLNGKRYLLGSNVDWGQDLRYCLWTAQKLFRGHPGAIYYAGGFNADVVTSVKEVSVLKSEGLKPAWVKWVAIGASYCREQGYSEIDVSQVLGADQDIHSLDSMQIGYGMQIYLRN